MSVPDVATPMGIRDRAILEVLHSTGVRRAELCALRIGDLDAERGTIIVRQGKGKKDRMIPIGSRAVQWIDKYIEEVRPHAHTRRRAAPCGRRLAARCQRTADATHDAGERHRVSYNAAS